jgi:hypothetical protein
MSTILPPTSVSAATLSDILTSLDRNETGSSGYNDLFPAGNRMNWNHFAASLDSAVQASVLKELLLSR